MATKKNKNNASQVSTVEKSSNDSSVSDQLRGVDWYHGMIPRQDAESQLKRDGDFLMRKTEQTPGKVVLAMSVKKISKENQKDKEEFRHFMVNIDPATNMFYFEATNMQKNLSQLVYWHINTKTVVTQHSGVILRRPIERPSWIVLHDAILVIKKLGEGAFGDVYSAELNKDVVAVKTMRAEATREARLRFMKEARVMRKYSHQHVVKLIGVAVHEHPLMIVMELCPNGSLQSHLKKKKAVEMEKLRFTTEAADGIAYLERSKCIHRDIAARNCLLSLTMELKISDFGMTTEDLKEIKDETLEKVPIKWLAPETMQEKVYTHKTDIWSFGVLVWEIYSDGAEPYPGLTKLQTRAKIVVNDYRMKMPDGTPPFVAEIVTGTCWQKSPEKRTSMDAIHKKLREFYDSKK